jgi:hypothetical protein
MKKQDNKNDKTPVINPIQQPLKAGSSSASLALNKNSYPLYMLEGNIDKISSAEPLKMDVNLRIAKMIANEKAAPVIKTIITKANTEYILSDLSTRNTTPINASNLKIGDDVVIWTVEPNDDFNKLNQFTATKIVKFKNSDSSIPSNSPTK